MNGLLLILTWLTPLLAALFGPRWGRRLLGSIPAGDILELFLPLLRRLRPSNSTTRGFMRPIGAVAGILRQSPTHSIALRHLVEPGLRSWPVAGILALGICGALLLLLWRLV